MILHLTYPYDARFICLFAVLSSVTRTNSKKRLGVRLWSIARTSAIKVHLMFCRPYAYERGQDPLCFEQVWVPLEIRFQGLDCKEDRERWHCWPWLSRISPSTRRIWLETVPQSAKPQSQVVVQHALTP
ncbi:hypothetical protein RSOLAG1IB_11146 [Rhizoctonia solani AG-1 IB]|uniref:Uncharacterized protein n=1 Tax=Thanatephorus cucumeris (strain AG1-IB / isolate 7/3/14) TaxID=1108050 RepID=A0A0B7F407_THACB|nr:hypothetical protein RSOLAG1IB_11146 [Rhizoctonia solani AG-1 IB]